MGETIKLRLYNTLTRTREEFAPIDPGNVRMYVVGGLTPGFEARNKGDLESATSRIEIQKGNVSFDSGIGFDLYFPLFKLSPEIRFSKGLSNVLAGGNSIFSDPIKRINTNTIGVYFIFQ